MQSGVFITARRVSYFVVFGALVLAGWLHLGTILLSVLFSYFALRKLAFIKSKWLAIALFVVVMLALGYTTARFVNAAVVALPGIADASIPPIIQWAERQGIEVPFADFESLKTLMLEEVKAQVHYVRNFANFAQKATIQLVYFIIGVVVAISIFLSNRFSLESPPAAGTTNLYWACGEEITARFASLFQSFDKVMAAQIIISAINTVPTSIFVFAVDLPYAPMLVGLTFAFGLIPVLGNLITNTIIVGLGFTVSPNLALAALVFLVVIHKLEYFLNSKIIGGRIRNPVWLTLLGLIVGERLMGIPGLILAPVVLHFIKVESSSVEAVENVPTVKPN